MTDRHASTPPAAAQAGLVLTPDEIVNYDLRRAARGYAISAVDDLLDQLAVQTQGLLSTIGELRRERDELHLALEQEREAETTLKKTLLTAQRAAEAALAEAREEADGVRAAAHQRAEELLAEAAEQAHELRETALRRARAEEAEMRRHRRAMDDHVHMLRAFAEDHRARLGNHLRQQVARLDAMDLPEPPPAPERQTEDLLDEPVLAPEAPIPLVPEAPSNEVLPQAERELEALLAEARQEESVARRQAAPSPVDPPAVPEDAHEVDLFGDHG